MTNQDLTNEQLRQLFADLIAINTNYVEAIVSRDKLAVMQEKAIEALRSRVDELEFAYGMPVAAEVSE